MKANANTPLLVITGTGTEIGKTHCSVALLKAWVRAAAAVETPSATWAGAGAPAPAMIAGIKPVESGITPEVMSDAQRLDAAGTFHVKHSPPYRLERPVSPHLAAREANVAIDPLAVVSYVNDVRTDADGVLVELPGGLFSPLGPQFTNADLAPLLRPTDIVLVAPDRLGVLHDTTATLRAAASAGLRVAGVILVCPATQDASTGTNAAELRTECGIEVLAELPRATPEELAKHPAIQRLAKALATQRSLRTLET